MEEQELPLSIEEGPDYDPGNVLHQSLWIMAGRPEAPPWHPTYVLHLQEDGSYLPDAPPPVITETPAYDSTNPDHVRRWELAGKPDLSAIDGDGQTWGPTVTTILINGQYVQQLAPVEPTPLTDVERTFQRVQGKLNADEAGRTGRAADPNGAVPLARALAATALLVSAWNYPSEADLQTSPNQAILDKIYADPTMNTNADSSVDQKRSVLHYMLVMLEGQQFGLDYQSELGAYERTASGEFLTKLVTDERDWLSLPCPKMHKDWPAFDSIRLMFQAVMK